MSEQRDGVREAKKPKFPRQLWIANDEVNFYNTRDFWLLFTQAPLQFAVECWNREIEREREKTQVLS